MRDSTLLKLNECAKIQLAIDSIADSVKTLSLNCLSLSEMVKDILPKNEYSKIGKFYQINEVAEKLSCSRPFIYKLLYEGKLKSIKIGKRMLRITENSLNAFIEENTILPMDIKNNF